MKTIIALVSFLSFISLPAEAVPVCPHNLFSCLQRNTDDFYLADHDRFYQVYDQAFAKAMQCKDYQDVANYLTIYSSSSDNAEVDESIQQDSEALLLLKPKCFFEGYLRLAPEQQENVLGNYHLFSRPNHVMTLLHKYMQGGKYKNIAAALYNANLEAYLSYGKGAEDAPMDDLYQQYHQRESK